MKYIDEIVRIWKKNVKIVNIIKILLKIVNIIKILLKILKKKNLIYIDEIARLMKKYFLQTSDDVNNNEI